MVQVWLYNGFRAMIKMVIKNMFGKFDMCEDAC